MTELRFHAALYRSESLDEAIARFAGFGTLSRVADGEYVRVSIEAGSEAREKRIADELANFALGLTIESRTLTGAG